MTPGAGQNVWLIFRRPHLSPVYPQFSPPFLPKTLKLMNFVVIVQKNKPHKIPDYFSLAVIPFKNVVVKGIQIFEYLKLNQMAHKFSDRLSVLQNVSLPSVLRPVAVTGWYEGNTRWPAKSRRCTAPSLFVSTASAPCAHGWKRDWRSSKPSNNDKKIKTCWNCHESLRSSLRTVEIWEYWPWQNEIGNTSSHVICQVR